MSTYGGSDPMPTPRRPGLVGPRPLTFDVRLLGIVLPFVVSLVCSYIDLSILLLAWLPFLIGVVSGALLRSWWALLVVPVMLALGTLPSVFTSGGFNPGGPSFVAGATLFGLLAVFPITVGAAIGVAMGHELERLDLRPNHSGVQE